MSFRPKCIQKLIETGPNMWDQALECADRTTGGSATITVFDRKFRVKREEMKEEKGLGRKCNLSRSKLPQTGLRCRMLESMLPPMSHDKCLFREELEHFPADQPLTK